MRSCSYAPSAETITTCYESARSIAGPMRRPARTQNVSRASRFASPLQAEPVKQELLKYAQKQVEDGAYGSSANSNASGRGSVSRRSRTEDSARSRTAETS